MYNKKLGNKSSKSQSKGIFFYKVKKNVCVSVVIHLCVCLCLCMYLCVSVHICEATSLDVNVSVWKCVWERALICFRRYMLAQRWGRVDADFTSAWREGKVIFLTGHSVSCLPKKAQIDLDTHLTSRNEGSEWIPRVCLNQEMLRVLLGCLVGLGWFECWLMICRRVLSVC